jgi:hypothetical protein
MYYLLTALQHKAIESELSHGAAWNLAGDKCIVHNDNGITINDYEQFFEKNHEVNDWRFNPNTEEWRNWITEDEYNGII